MTAIPPDNRARSDTGSSPADDVRPAGSVSAGSVPIDDTRAAGSVPADDRNTLREDVVERERREFGGFKFGSAFFGWLAATGLAVILTALVTAAGVALGFGATGGNADAAGLDPDQTATIGIVGAIALVVVIFIAYFCGGYVAGRMARFDGVKQGLAVWLWAVVVAVVVAIIGAIAGSQFDILANVNGFPRIPVNESGLTAVGVITLVAVAVVSLVGALLGGVAGMRFHRRVDRAGLGR